MAEPRIAIEPGTTDAVLFDLDGVITSTDRLHASAWKATFDELLRDRDQVLFDVEQDYPQHVDGKPRERGIRDLLAARGIELPEGEPNDPPGLHSVAALAKRKNRRFHERLREEGVDVYPDAIALLDDLAAAEVTVGLFSASRNARRVLERADLAERFEVIVDGNAAADLGLEGKPAPDTLLAAARRLAAAPERTVVLEDSEAGVQAARAGGFGTVIGVDRVGHADEMEAHGADVALASLDAVQVPTDRAAELPHALDADEILERVSRRRPVVFLDFDGTLSEIVPEPDQASIAPAVRETVARLARACTVAVISGRGLDDVQARVDLDGLHYAGSHGFEIETPEGERTTHEVAVESRDAVAAAEDELERRLADVEGVILERKPFSVAVHDRQAADADLPRVRETVDDVLAQQPDLRLSPGKRVHELRPDVDWDKGRAVEHLLAELGVEPAQTPVVYVGDDATDEDAFRALPEGIGVLVRDGHDLTHADYGLAGTDEVATFLDIVAATLEEGSR
jgi:alpha,alpha-trehalase